MIDQINAELLKLQKELLTFEKALDQINKTGELTKEVIDAAKQMHEDFKKQIAEIQSLFSEYMNKTYKHTEENINKIFITFKERMEEEEKVLNKFVELSMQSENLTQKFIKKISEDYENNIKQLLENTESHLNEIKEYFKTEAELLKKDISKLVENHNNRLDTEQKILDNYLDLASSTAELSKFLKSVDFPTRLDQIDNKAQELKKELEQVKLNQKNLKLLIESIIADDTTRKILEKVINIENDQTPQNILEVVKQIKQDTTNREILELTKEIRKKSKTNKTLTIIILVLLVLFIAGFNFIFFYFFPDFLSTVFGG